MTKNLNAGKKYWAVTGGIYTDFTFSKIKPENVEMYGPFDTYEEAAVAWKSEMWLKVDNALHKLNIVEWNMELRIFREGLNFLL